MIPITLEIIGPGIEEEYADAMDRIAFLLDAFKDYPASNDTAHGRVVYQLRWLKQEVDAQRLPVPVHKSWIGTLCYVVGSCEVDDTKEIAKALGELKRILQGPGLLKPRHFPVIAAQIDDLVADIHLFGDPLTPDETQLVADLEEVAKGIRSGQIIPPLTVPKGIHPLRLALMHANRLKEVFPPHPDLRRFRRQSDHLQLPLFENWRPYVAQKPPLAAPNPGLGPEAPDFTLVRDLVKTKVTKT
ncbi:hypothetical protein [Acidocella facilis]|uniref:hypothetical protein n=1 Tax=Acidocella facilis TaxID=525 RepID=UPI001F36C78A|nr:hypothetical protein [Acidocella facilis]